MLSLCLALATLLPQHDEALAQALARAGDNRAQLESALELVDAEQRRGVEFLLQHMPQDDLRSLSAEFLLEHVRYAYRAWKQAPWSDTVPERYFLEHVLPYASINERRDAWRQDFYQRFRPLVADAQTPSQAAAILNQKVFGMVGVRYSTQRPKADQSPYESIEAKMASCTGLSVLLIDACRAVGVPARFVGTPRWSDDSGNHSWVEIWDDGWHFTGAAEPSGDELNQAWFTGRAAKAQRDSQRYGIFAVSFVPTPQRFPMVWRRDADHVHAVNVTDRYTNKAVALPEGSARVRFRVVGEDGTRRGARLRVRDAVGAVVYATTTKDERFDANDHATAVLELGAQLSVEAQHDGASAEQVITVDADEQLVTLALTDGLSASAAAAARAELWAEHTARVRAQREAAFVARELVWGEHRMPFWYTVRGDAAENGRSLWISLHGGGGAPAKVNDQQWGNQKKLYAPEEGVYVAPRAPTNTWNLWHQAHIDALFDQLIEAMVVFEGVDPDRVYLLGYSAGGDGVYQLAPRMADRWAAAAMMAGHPNDANPEGLRNTAFTLHMGAEDAAYNRNKVAAAWRDELAKLRAADPTGYDHWVEIHDGKAHWMDREDAAAIPWMAERTRDLRPERVVWRQSGRTHPRFYWLAVDEPQAGAKVVVERQGQEIRILEAAGVARLTLRLDDAMLDLDESVVVRQGDAVLFEGRLPRRREVLARTLAERGDPVGVWPAEVTVTLR